MALAGQWTRNQYQRQNNPFDTLWDYVSPRKPLKVFVVSQANEYHCAFIRMTKVDFTFGSFQGACTRLR